ncbi:hypothetical protein GCM10027256_33910 [Novispirillum itersonii subsp. nipponicum]|uniref:Uncharacterized protein n=1 Tax=Novispirillum itersonii TaxID=189 RepID=A0A7X0DP03_NOVIT|nr:hypothetical protein [Novispirillum itersonii]
MCVTRSFEEIYTLLWREALDKLSDLIPQRINGALWLLPQQGFEFRKGHLNGVHVGGIWRQIKALCARCFYGRLNILRFVCREIVHDNDIPLPQRGAKDLADVGKECLPIHGAIKDKGRRDP